MFFDNFSIHCGFLIVEKKANDMEISFLENSHCVSLVLQHGDICVVKDDYNLVLPLTKIIYLHYVKIAILKFWLLW